MGGIAGIRKLNPRETMDEANDRSRADLRQERERQYYEEYFKLFAPVEVCFDPILGAEKRPWNPYWFVCEVVKRQFTSMGQSLLDFGCGPGNYSILFARLGYEVFGFDISPNGIASARHLAVKYGLEDRTHFGVGTAEQLDYASDSFDVVVGIDILHHVEIVQSLRECLRVLKRGGVATFKEPVAVPVFEPLRNSRFGQWLVPKTVSYERHITADERKLTADDLKAIRDLCPNLSIRRFRLFSRLDAFYRKNGQNGLPILTTLERIDARALRACPSLRAFGGEVVLTLRK